MSLDEDREKRERGAARSLLQKAVRRGSPLAVEQAARFLLAQGDRTWLRMRTVVILFEECWPMASDLVLPRDPEELIRLLSRIALTRKHKDAAGLGALAHDYHGGERGMLSFTEDDSELRLVAEAMKRPQDFFGWALKTAKGDDARSVISFAVKHLSCATWPWDKACVLAGAFFAATQGVPSLAAAPQLEGDFPYWVALDKHTEIGRDAMFKLSSKIRVDYKQIASCSFYFEGALTNGCSSPSVWLDDDAAWSLSKAGLSMDDAGSLWQRIRPSLIEAVASQAEELRQRMLATAKGPKQLSLLG